jgi:hypothetical protein
MFKYENFEKKVKKIFYQKVIPQSWGAALTGR